MSQQPGRGERGSNRHPDRRNTQGRQRNRGGHGENRGPRKFSQSAPSQRSRRADPARLVAFRVLRAVALDDAYANLVLPHEIRRAKLDKRDAAFATELTYGALRAQGTYDAILAQNVDRELDQLDPPVLNALRLGAHQLLAMRVDDHAAVNETVGLVRDQVGTGPSGLVNAVLRRVGEKSLDEWVAQLTAEVGELDALALRYAHPAWVVRALRQSLKLHGRGEDLEQLLQADNLAPEVHLVGLPGQLQPSGAESLEQALQAGARPSELIDGAAVFRGGDIGRLAGVREGALRVQDIGSQWVARALAEPAVSPGERWLDLCAGPGGKAALLGALAAEYGVHLTANEPAAHRAELVQKALAPVPAEAWSVRTGDGRTIGELGTQFDRIIVDAPCTGLGALRRRPESRWRRQLSDLAELTVLQEQLLDAAVGVLAEDGLLAYVTCSPHVAETLVQVEDALRRHSDLELLDAHEVMTDVALPAGQELLGSRPAGSSEVAAKTVQLWPHIHGTDAMFFALMRKAES
ncbi:RsmB/NOP family class I SAM-dependent RNA methyltransferase [Nesterenkonia alkaliphila]|uniref:rRNA small subunit methyltransferase B n=1 Tax=Nesterenkonia alkaliphila TaxID=1463631 RepID=A0A7K1UL47_9MICC|nr:transcription antitermination factor NusB [Nesterenkonia alkaliphila]MVT27144.1 rRNA small subunit methyltransferase B [Nesterenkonia alkaliphila]GFZ91226.1 rRNA cytosine-C5-methyltransferase [Nesterenkonia alkaliphila]